jgi:hypothetical protein
MLRTKTSYAVLLLGAMGVATNATAMGENNASVAEKRGLSPIITDKIRIVGSKPTAPYSKRIWMKRSSARYATRPTATSPWAASDSSVRSKPHWGGGRGAG